MVVFDENSAIRLLHFYKESVLFAVKPSLILGGSSLCFQIGQSLRVFRCIPVRVYKGEIHGQMMYMDLFVMTICCY